MSVRTMKINNRKVLYINKECADKDIDFNVMVYPRPIGGHMYYLAFTPAISEERYSELEENQRHSTPASSDGIHGNFYKLSGIDGYPYVSLIELPSNIIVLMFSDRPSQGPVVDIIFTISRYNHSALFEPHYDDNRNIIEIIKRADNGVSLGWLEKKKLQSQQAQEIVDKDMINIDLMIDLEDK